MDAFKLLKDDHQKASQVFHKLQGTKAASAKDKVFAELKQELEVHTQIEEQIFYPALQSAGETADLVKESLREHGAVKQMLQNMSLMDKDDPEWTASLERLMENVEHHVREEEGELFPKARQVLSADSIDDLGDRLQKRKSELMKKH